MFVDEKKNVDMNNPLAWLEYRNKNKNIDFTKEIIEDQKEDNDELEDEDLDEEQESKEQEEALDDVSSSGRKSIPYMEEPEDLTDLDVEMTPDGTSISVYKAKEKPSLELPKREAKPKKESVKKKEAPKKVEVVKREKVAMATVRQVPNVLYEAAASCFKNARMHSMPDVMAAYLALQTGITDCLTPTQRAILKSYDKSDPMLLMNDRVKALENSVAKITRLNEELELMLAYVLFDRLGFRQDSAATPSDVNLNEPGMSEIIARVKQQSKYFKEMENRHSGRPIR